MGAFARRRFAVASGAVVVLVASLLGWFALRSEGAVVHQGDLWGGGMWVTKSGDGCFGGVVRVAGGGGGGAAGGPVGWRDLGDQQCRCLFWSGEQGDRAAGCGGRDRCCSGVVAGYVAGRGVGGGGVSYDR